MEGDGAGDRRRGALCVCPQGWYPVCGRAALCGCWERRLLIAGFMIQEIADLPDVFVWLTERLPPVVQIRAGISGRIRENWCCRAVAEAEVLLSGADALLARLERLAARAG